MLLVSCVMMMMMMFSIKASELRLNGNSVCFQRSNGTEGILF